MYMPEDTSLTPGMRQSGQYNYPRCIARGECAAAQLTMGEFVNAALHAVFLLNKRYMPYYKWRFRALSAMPTLAELYSPLEYLISSGNSESETSEKTRLVELVAQSVTDALVAESLSGYKGTELEGQAYAVNDRISDANLRNLHILYGV